MYDNIILIANKYISLNNKDLLEALDGFSNQKWSKNLNYVWDIVHWLTWREEVSELDENMINVHQWSYALSKEKTLVTSGLFTCTWFFWYNKETWEIFLAHLSDTDNAERIMRWIKHESTWWKFQTYFANPTIPSSKISELIDTPDFKDTFGYPISLETKKDIPKEWVPGSWIGIRTNWTIFDFTPQTPI